VNGELLARLLARADATASMVAAAASAGLRRDVDSAVPPAPPREYARMARATEAGGRDGWLASVLPPPSTSVPPPGLPATAETEDDDTIPAHLAAEYALEAALAGVMDSVPLRSAVDILLGAPVDATEPPPSAAAAAAAEHAAAVTAILEAVARDAETGATTATAAAPFADADTGIDLRGMATRLEALASSAAALEVRLPRIAVYPAAAVAAAHDDTGGLGGMALLAVDARPAGAAGGGSEDGVRARHLERTAAAAVQEWVARSCTFLVEYDLPPLVAPAAEPAAAGAGDVLAAGRTVVAAASPDAGAAAAAFASATATIAPAANNSKARSGSNEAAAGAAVRAVPLLADTDIRVPAAVNHEWVGALRASTTADTSGAAAALSRWLESCVVFSLYLQAAGSSGGMGALDAKPRGRLAPAAAAAAAAAREATASAPRRMYIGEARVPLRQLLLADALPLPAPRALPADGGTSSRLVSHALVLRGAVELTYTRRATRQAAAAAVAAAAVSSAATAAPLAGYPHRAGGVGERVGADVAASRTDAWLAGLDSDTRARIERFQALRAVATAGVTSSSGTTPAAGASRSTKRRPGGALPPGGAKVKDDVPETVGLLDFQFTLFLSSPESAAGTAAVAPAATTSAPAPAAAAAAAAVAAPHRPLRGSGAYEWVGPQAMARRVAASEGGGLPPASGVPSSSDADALTALHAAYEADAYAVDSRVLVAWRYARSMAAAGSDGGDDPVLPPSVARALPHLLRSPPPRVLCRHGSKRHAPSTPGFELDDGAINALAARWDGIATAARRAPRGVWQTLPGGGGAWVPGWQLASSLPCLVSPGGGGRFGATDVSVPAAAVVDNGGSPAAAVVQLLAMAVTVVTPQSASRHAQVSLSIPGAFVGNGALPRSEWRVGSAGAALFLLRAGADGTPWAADIGLAVGAQLRADDGGVVVQVVDGGDTFIAIVPPRALADAAEQWLAVRLPAILSPRAADAPCLPPCYAAAAGVHTQVGADTDVIPAALHLTLTSTTHRGATRTCLLRLAFGRVADLLVLLARDHAASRIQRAWHIRHPPRAAVVATSAAPAVVVLSAVDPAAAAAAAVVDTAAAVVAVVAPVAAPVSSLTAAADPVSIDSVVVANGAGGSLRPGELQFQVLGCDAWPAATTAGVLRLRGECPAGAPFELTWQPAGASAAHTLPLPAGSDGGDGEATTAAIPNGVLRLPAEGQYSDDDDVAIGGVLLHGVDDDGRVPLAAVIPKPLIVGVVRAAAASATDAAHADLTVPLFLGDGDPATAPAATLRLRISYVCRRAPPAPAMAPVAAPVAELMAPVAAPMAAAPVAAAVAPVPRLPPPSLPPAPMAAPLVAFAAPLPQLVARPSAPPPAFATAPPVTNAPSSHADLLPELASMLQVQAAAAVAANGDVLAAAAAAAALPAWAAWPEVGLHDGTRPTTAVLPAASASTAAASTASTLTHGGLLDAATVAVEVGVVEAAHLQLQALPSGGSGAPWRIRVGVALPGALPHGTVWHTAPVLPTPEPGSSMLGGPPGCRVAWHAATRLHVPADARTWATLLGGELRAAHASPPPAMAHDDDGDEFGRRLRAAVTGGGGGGGGGGCLPFGGGGGGGGDAGGGGPGGGRGGPGAPPGPPAHRNPRGGGGPRHR